MRYGELEFADGEPVCVSTSKVPAIFRMRCNMRRKPRADGLYALIEEAVAGLRTVRYSWLERIEPVVGCAPPPIRQATTPVPEVARCEPAVAYWKANTKRGAIYLDAEPGGTFRAAMVLPQADGTSTQAASARGLSIDDLEDQLGLLARRLVRSLRAEVLP